MPHPSPRPWLAPLFAALLATAGAAADPVQLSTPKDDTRVTASARLAPGAWSVPDAAGDGALRITTDGVTLDLRDAALLGAPEGTPADALRGVGVWIEGARGVTIRGGVIRGYKIAIKAVNAPELVLEDVDASENFRQHLGSTPEREDPADWLWPHHNDEGEWEARYGAGFSLTDCDGPTVRRCRARHGQNGLLLTRCKRARVYANDFSFNSGWGIALYRATRGTIARNRCDWCVRGMSPGVYHRGQDSAGILVFEQSSHNTFVGNSATHSGDGFFLYAGHETTRDTGKGGCDGNLVFDNDFSHAVANAIEATFSRDNVFVRNDCSGSEHGIWAGYSSRTLIAGNRIHDCVAAGISIEHGQENRIVANDIRGGRAGVHLWWDPDKELVEGVYGKARDTASARSLLQGNDIVGASVAVRLVGDHGTRLRWNVLHGTEACLLLGSGARPGEVIRNQFRGTRLPTRDAPVAVQVPPAGDWRLPLDNTRRGLLRASAAIEPSTLSEGLMLVRPAPRLPSPPALSPAMAGPPARLAVRMPRGRTQIRMGPWGPLDPRTPHVAPTDVSACGRETHLVLSGQGAWRLARQQGRVLVEPTAGTLPASVRVRVAPMPGDALVESVVPFALDFELAGRPHTVRGHLLEALWDVRWFEWSEDPREDEDAWRALVSGAPTHRAPYEALQFPWQGAGPPSVRADRFATVATCTLRLAKGVYRVRTVSDDGVRVFVDGRRVIERWTHHAPMEDAAEVELGGLHTLRVEHFELDGWAHLELHVERSAR